MATVYLARDLKHDRLVALKVLRPELAAVIGAERFLQEIHISARLDHPHILTLIDSGETEGFLWYVLPYVRGESLRARLAREKQLSIDEAVRIATQVASALDYAHRSGVVHRDIKPENILLHEGEAVVADFGIALAVREAGGSRITETGLSLGTPQYMSPEQATGASELDARSDVYSLAAVLYEMLAGEPPHTGPTAHAVIAKLVTERPTRIRTVRDTVPEGIDAAIAKALAKVPADRFQDAGLFATALGTPYTAPADGKRRQLAIAAALGGAALLAVLVWVWQPWRGPRRSVAPVATLPSVAVLPFDNLTGNPEDRYLSDGMTEEVVGQLTKVSGLKVISRTSTEALKGSHLTLKQIADTLGVRHIVEGSVRHAGNRIRVAVDLIDAATDAHVWASAYDRDLTDVFGVQEEIARHVADSLVSMVGGGQPTLGHIARTEHSRAYAAYIAGRYLMQRRTWEALRAAEERFQQAIAQDSTYAPAYAGLASVYHLRVYWAYPGIDFYEVSRRAVAMAERAIALDSTLGEAYAVRGRALTIAWAPDDQVAADFKRALDLRPNSPDVHQWHAAFLARQGRYEEGLAEVQRAIALDPLAPGIRSALASMSLAARHYTEAEQAAERTLALEPGLLRARELQALADLLSGNAAQCVTRNLGPYVAIRAICLQALGKTREAAEVVDSLQRSVQPGAIGDSIFSPVVAAGGLAAYYAWIGSAGESLAWLERAYAYSPEGEDFRVIASGLYDKVRNDPKFNAGLHRLRRQIHERVLGTTRSVRLN